LQWKALSGKKLIFLARRERPEEAPIVALEKCFLPHKLVMEDGIGLQNEIILKWFVLF